MIDHNDEGQWVALAYIETAGLAVEPILFRENGDILQRGHEPQDWLEGRYALPARISFTDGGNLVWAASVTDDLMNPDQSAVLLFNQSVLLEAGKTIIDGKLVSAFTPPGGNMFEVSPNGEWIATTLIFEDGSRFFYRLRIPSPGTTALLAVGVLASLRRRR